MATVWKETASVPTWAKALKSESSYARRLFHQMAELCHIYLIGLTSARAFTAGAAGLSPVSDVIVSSAKQKAAPGGGGGLASVRQGVGGRPSERWTHPNWS